MKKSILIVLASIFLSYPMNLIGGDYDTPHTFSCGDTISADMMNEIFDYIKNANKTISASELIGTWSCLLSTTKSECRTAGWDNATDGRILPYVYNTDTLVMIDNDNGTYSYTTPVPNIFNCADYGSDSAGFGDWIVKNNVLYVVYSNGGVAGVATDDNNVKIVRLKKVSNTKLLMEYDSNPVFAECDKQNLPPIAPTLDNVTASGKTVSLAWADNSTDETGFKVLRRDSCDGSFSTVTTTSEDATSYSDTVTAAGSYWYRVSAINSNGDSVASKIIRVDVE
jgi:hypothetical protein